MRKHNRKLIVQKLLLVACICILLLSFGCGRQAEAVIEGSGEDITQSEKDYEVLSTSHADKFSLEDLTVGQLKYFMTEEEVVNILGEPLEIDDLSEKNKELGMPEEKNYHYEGRVLTFSCIEQEYVLTSFSSERTDDIFARNLSVGNTLDDILNGYYRDENCMNNPYMSLDRTIIYGKFLYGSFTMESFENIKYKNKVQYGIIDFNGSKDWESADNYLVAFTYFEPPYMSETVSVYDDYAQILFEMDGADQITSISWRYYPEETH